MTATWRLFLERLEGPDYATPIRAGLQWLDIGNRIRPGDPVFIKPNLTFPVYRKAVMTHPGCVEALVVALKDYTDRVIVGEADSGGYNRFDIDEVMRKIGLMELEKKYGVRVVNLSRLPSKPLEVRTRGRTLSIPFPALLREECALLVSAGVPKIHMNTLVSMTVKNLWGCIPDPSARLRLHPFLDEVLLQVVRHIPPALALIDGRYGLNRSGPMRGEVVNLNWLLMADHLYAADASCCRLMQIEPSRVPYLRHADRAGAGTPTPESALLNRDFKPFIGPRFTLKRQWTDLPGLLAFRSSALSYLAYFSPLAGLLHKLLYLFREPFYDYEKPGQTPDADG